MPTQINWNLSSTLSGFGGITSGDTVTGGSNLTTTNRLVSALATGSVKLSQLADSISGGVLTVAGTLSANRTVTFTDASYTVPGLETDNTWTGINTFSSIAPFPPLAWVPASIPSFPANASNTAAGRLSQYTFSR